MSLAIIAPISVVFAIMERNDDDDDNDDDDTDDDKNDNDDDTVHGHVHGEVLFFAQSHPRVIFTKVKESGGYSPSLSPSSLSAWSSS